MTSVSRCVAPGREEGGQWAKLRRERIVAAVQAREAKRKSGEEGECSNGDEGEKPKPADVAGSDRQQPSAEASPQIPKGPQGGIVNYVVKPKPKPSSRIPHEAVENFVVSKPPDPVIVRGKKPQVPERNVLVDKDLVVSRRHQPVQFTEPPKDPVPVGVPFSAPPVRPGAKSKCVKRIEAIERKRQERRISQQQKEEEKISVGGENGGDRLIRKSMEDCCVLRPSSAEETAFSKPGHQNKVGVYIRKRPMNLKECGATSDCVSVGFDTKQTAAVVVHELKTRVDLRKDVEKHVFNFDGSFSARASTEEVFSRAVSPIVQAALVGSRVAARNGPTSNGTVFAYGQTGSGKTYTMARVHQYAISEVFRCKPSDSSINVSCFEIYGGKVLDLLSGKAALPVREDARGHVKVVELSEQCEDSPEKVWSLAERAEALRSTGTTAANDESSRSHYVFQATIRAKGVYSDDGKGRVLGRLRLVDLAGSERGADTHSADRKTRQEGAEINKSLLALKECIRALDSGANGAHVPFRGCRLTHLLRDAFVGENSQLAVLAHISPGNDCVEHTLNTLRYAAHVKEFGRAGPPGVNALRVPVGKKGADEVDKRAFLLKMHAEHVQNLRTALTEAEALLAHPPSNNAALVSAMGKLVEKRKKGDGIHQKQISGFADEAAAM